MVLKEKKQVLTNEKLIQRFRSQFDLVNYAIRLAENMIKTGREPRIKTEVQSKAFQILAEIHANKDSFETDISKAIEEAPKFRDYQKG